ncbi:putative neuraminidase [Alkalihalobacillus xiaoxiensis]|uniref:Neuraminidase n=1 Tax=Shouchella xiaoxiensis TaxID=766895 RepID=A0ABS2SZL6_9BACI|nr:sialidase family protein [Shouchella xiaoxiensis]MBM7840940.1 putative neuraminidase [Shouchella xiaoxiensis]
MNTSHEGKYYAFNDETVPFSLCHASNCFILPNKNILVAWFAGSYEGADDTAIWMTTVDEKGFSLPVIVANDGDIPHWNPVFFMESEDQKIWLLYKIGRQIDTWQTMVRYSNDLGRTWTNPQELVAGDRGGRGPVRTKMISVNNGTILAGGSVEKGIWHSFIDRSLDGGLNWVKSESIAIPGLVYSGHRTATSDIAVSEQSFYGRGVIQPTLWTHGTEDVYALMRSSEGVLFRSNSHDYGLTWSDPVKTDFPNNNSGIDIVTLSSGNLVMCSNPVELNWGPRSPLCLHLSKDNGFTWELLCTLEEGEGEYSYPSLTRKEHIVCLSYTWNRKSIVVWRFDERKWEE